MLIGSSRRRSKKSQRQRVLHQKTWQHLATRISGKPWSLDSPKWHLPRWISWGYHLICLHFWTLLQILALIYGPTTNKLLRCYGKSCSAVEFLWPQATAANSCWCRLHKNWILLFYHLECLVLLQFWPIIFFFQNIENMSINLHITRLYCLEFLFDWTNNTVVSLQLQIIGYFQNLLNISFLQQCLCL